MFTRFTIIRKETPGPGRVLTSNAYFAFSTLPRKFVCAIPSNHPSCVCVPINSLLLLQCGVVSACVCVCVWTSENQLFLISGDVRVCTLATISCPILQKQTSFEHE